ncbi:tetratricopeptide repeat-containing protein [Saccharothrix yanglingensis]|uniref:tetratricopeptide repeat-containing protein n=1 Tax=Saccharothrix yanglingensis TaxID=659496 RepID=UPI0027D2508C|nr:tetratricopeptide repeat-containing protein [Saccharothrix yanglingensis]
MTWDRRTSVVELFRAVDALDRPRVEALCADLVEDLRVDERPYPLDQAHRVLGELRRKRYLEPLRRVADALIQAGRSDPTIRRHYAQALLDQGVLTAAVAVLERLLEDVASSPYEATEARGLLGRAYKQMYVTTAPTAPERRRRFLELAVEHYRGVYDQAGLARHGINLVALLVRAREDGVDLPGDPLLIARNVLAAATGLGHAAACGTTAPRWRRAWRWAGTRRRWSGCTPTSARAPTRSRSPGPCGSCGTCGSWTRPANPACPCCRCWRARCWPVGRPVTSRSARPS